MRSERCAGTHEGKEELFLDCCKSCDHHLINEGKQDSLVMLGLYVAMLGTMC